MIFFNGTTKDNIQCKDLCKEERHVRIAHNNDDGFFKVDNITNSMVEFPYMWPIAGDWGIISYEFVILKSFFSKFNIKPTWINCNFTFGWFDYEAGHWTGAVGQVEILYFNQE